MPKVFNRPLKIGGHAIEVNEVEIQVLEYDGDSKILLCTGTTVPTADSSGFAKGCLFIKTDAADGTKGLYENQGTTSASDFNLVGDISSAELSFADTEFIKDDSGNELLAFGVNASAENHIKISNAADGNAPVVEATGDDTNVDLYLLSKGTGSVMMGKAATSQYEKVLYIQSVASDLTHGVGQGALAIGMSRPSDYPMTASDGNSDTAFKITLNQRSVSTTYGRSRAMDIAVKVRDAGASCYFVEGMQMSAASESGTTLTDLTVARFISDHGGTASGNIVGVQIQDISQSATGTYYGLLINSAEYDIAREHCIYIDSLDGSWVNGITFDGAITNVLDFAESDGTNGATLKAGSYSTSGNEVKVAIDVAGVTYYLIGWATAS